MFDAFDDACEVMTFSDLPEGERLDSCLCKRSGLSRSRVAALMDAGFALSGETVLKKSDKAVAGESVTLLVPPPETLSIEPEDIPLSVVYEDESLLVVDKPQGMVVHPAAGSPNHTLVNALLFHCDGALSGINGVLRPGIVHRIDKDTSGLLVVAKSDEAHCGLAKQIKDHHVSRRYRAVLWGAPRSDCGEIRTGIGRAKTDRKKMATYPLGAPNTREAHSSYRVLERFAKHCLATFSLHTGRTHQIRVHAASIGHPVVGDPLYAAGKEDFGLPGQLLHAATLGFVHPVTGDTLLFESPLPDAFAAFLDRLRGGAV